MLSLHLDVTNIYRRQARVYMNARVRISNKTYMELHRGLCRVHIIVSCSDKMILVRNHYSVIYPCDGFFYCNVAVKVSIATAMD